MAMSFVYRLLSYERVMCVISGFRREVTENFPFSQILRSKWWYNFFSTGLQMSYSL